MKFLSGTVYSKALAIFLAASLLLLGTVAALSQLIILRELYLSEQREMKAMLQRFYVVLEREGKPLESALGEWARSANTNDITPSILRELKVDFVAVAGPSGISRLVCADSSVEALLSDGGHLADIIRQAGQTRGAEVRVGYALIKGQLCAVAFRPFGAEPRETLIGGKFFNQSTWGFLDGLFSATIRFNPFQNMAVDDVTGRDILKLLTAQEVVIETDAESQIVGYRLISDISGTPLGYVSISQARPLRQEGLRAIQIFLTGISLAGGALVVVVWILLDRTILARIKELTRKLEAEKRLSRLPVQLDFRGDDELGMLARSIEDLARLLQNTQSQYRTVVEDQTEMICRFDAAWRLAFANEVFLRMFQLERSRLEECQVSSLLPAAPFGDFVRRFEELTPANPLATFISEIELGSGGTLWFRNTLRRSFSPAGESLGGQWVAADITAQVEAERQKFESARRFRLLFETASDGILLIRGPDRIITDFNPSLCQMLMLAGSDMLQRSIDEIPVFGPCFPIVRDYQLTGLQGYRAPRNECRLERADGSALYVEIRCSGYQTKEDFYIQLNFRNISDRVQTEREMRRLSAQLLRLQDEERRRIARELHDSTAQNLSALEMNMSLLEPLVEKAEPRARRLMEDTRRIAGECSRELRNISYLLHPPLIDEVGLAFAVKWFADGFARRTGINVTVDIGENFPRLGADLEMPLFRVVQEAMTNVYRHSGADRSWVTLHCLDDQLTVEIRDNGHGFKESSASDVSLGERSTGFGVGIPGMRERIAHCGGRLEVENTRLGVTISIRLRLSSSHALN